MKRTPEEITELKLIYILGGGVWVLIWLAPILLGAYSWVMG